MPYAIIKDGTIQLIVISKEEAEKRPDVISVPKGVVTGYTFKDGIYTAPADKTPHRFTDAEMVKIYTLAKTNDEAAYYRDVIMNNKNLSFGRAKSILQFFIAQGIIP